MRVFSDEKDAVVRPCMPLKLELFDAGADYLAGLVTTDAHGMEQARGAIRFPGMMDNGLRVDQFSPGTSYPGIVSALSA